MTTASYLTDGLDALISFVQQEAVDELAPHLSGLSGEARFPKCVCLAVATIAAMQDDGDIGTVEIAVVLATLKAAVTKAA